MARGLRQALHRGAGTTVGSPGPKQTNGAPHPPRARPSARRRPGSPVPTPPGGRAESAPGQRRRLWARGERSPPRSARPHSRPPALPGPAAAPVGARSGRADSASALPHLGGSERPRRTAPHLAGPPLPPTLSAGAGRRGGTGGAGGGAWGRGRPTRGGVGRGRGGLLHFLQVKFYWAREG